jgi:hypothetical protein
LDGSLLIRGSGKNTIPRISESILTITPGN